MTKTFPNNDEVMKTNLVKNLKRFLKVTDYSKNLRITKAVWLHIEYYFKEKLKTYVGQFISTN